MLTKDGVNFKTRYQNYIRVNSLRKENIPKYAWQTSKFMKQNLTYLIQSRDMTINGAINTHD
jgi:hypothetical protein